MNIRRWGKKAYQRTHRRKVKECLRSGSKMRKGYRATLMYAIEPALVQSHGKRGRR